MRKWLWNTWVQIRGNVKWAVVTTLGAILGGWISLSVTAIMTTLVTWWGWVLGLPGPHLVVLALLVAFLSLGIVALGVFIVTRLHQGNHPVPPPPPPLPLAPRTPPTPRFPQLTTEHIVKLKEAVHPHTLRIKLVSTPEYLFFAQDLERALRIAGCRFVPDPETNKTIFCARSLHPNNQVVLRYRNSDTDAMLNFTYFTLTQTLESICAFQFAFRFLTSATQVDLFPPESSIDHFQIEIGGAP